MKKRCTKCGGVKWLCEFAAEKRNRKDGKCSQCRACKQKQKVEFQNKNPERARKWEKENPGKMMGYRRRWIENNLEKKREWDNHPRQQEKRRIYVKENVDKLKDPYIKHLLKRIGISKGQMSHEMMEAKRQQIMLFREVEQFRKEIRCVTANA